MEAGQQLPAGSHYFWGPCCVLLALQQMWAPAVHRRDWIEGARRTPGQRVAGRALVLPVVVHLGTLGTGSARHTRTQGVGRTGCEGKTCLEWSTVA